ncbi:MAG TPA: S41 family peptidase [Allosphingosinicella sp.]|nr:S41 family peptidase [Allosphingosinicella sp.]
MEAVAQKILDAYVLPDVAERYAAALRANLKAGRYASITSPEALAKQVTDDLQAVAFEGHLKLATGAPAGQMAPASALPPSTPIETSVRLSKSVAYIRFGDFASAPETLAKIQQFLSDNADAETLIFDVRTSIGGLIAQTDVIFPFLFAKETVLLHRDTRRLVEERSKGPSPDGPTLRRIASPDSVVRREHVALPSTTEKRLQDAKVYVLTSSRTRSAAEHLALAIRRTGRGEVIGETTFGAGHYGAWTGVPGDFSVFIPIGRSFDPDTGKDWEGVGVAPTIKVPAERALVEALVRSGVKPALAERLSRQHGPDPQRMSQARPDRPEGSGI